MSRISETATLEILSYLNLCSTIVAPRCLAADFFACRDEFLPAAGFAEFENPRARRIDAAPAGLGEHALRWLVERLLG
jgi:hypothetical protein